MLSTLFSFLLIVNEVSDHRFRLRRPPCPLPAFAQIYEKFHRIKLHRKRGLGSDAAAQPTGARGDAEQQLHHETDDRTLGALRLVSYPFAAWHWPVSNHRCGCSVLRANQRIPAVRPRRAHGEGTLREHTRVLCDVDTEAKSWDGAAARWHEQKVSLVSASEPMQNLNVM
jgi:hypothetical protein